jgi:hypothetical protein
MTLTSDSPDLNAPKAGDDRAKRTLSYLDQARQTASLSKKDKVGFLVTLGLLLNGLTLLIVLGLIPFLFSIASKPAPALVQTSDGKTMRVLALEGNQRSPQVLKDTITVALTRLFTWRNFFTPTTGEELRNPKADPGIDIPSKNGSPTGKVPTEVWQATFALSGDMQASYLGTLAKMVGDAGVFGPASAQVSIEILNVSTPTAISDGTWKTLIVANLVKVDRLSKVPVRVPFNKEVFLRAVPVPRIREEGTAAAKALSQVIADARATGLEIYAMRDAVRPDLQPNTTTPSPSVSPSASTPTPTTSP